MLNETVATVSLSTVLAVLSFVSGEAEARGGWAVSPTGLAMHAFTWDQMTPHLDDCRCSGIVKGSFLETAHS